MSSDSALFATEAAGPNLLDRFVVPPFSILDARQGYWKDRKRGWLSLGIQSEQGRSAPVYAQATLNRVKGQQVAVGDGTSIFDPVMCELVYRWFAKPGAQVLDPFAGGSVRGVVAAHLGLRYWGCDLREEQVLANRAQAAALCGDLDVGVLPYWHAGDSATVVRTSAPRADLVFTCPPYGDLEVYSDDPADISGMEWGDFLVAYRDIIDGACAQLHDHRFAAVVVGDFRDKRSGMYRNFLAETTEAFARAGLHYYNEGIIVTPVGSLAVRAGKQFAAGRKLGRQHQQLLVYVKGDWRQAANWCGNVTEALDAMPAPDDQLALFGATAPVVQGAYGVPA